MKVKPVKTSGMIKAKEVIMKSKKMKQQIELNIINKQQKSITATQPSAADEGSRHTQQHQQQQPKRVALHQTVESVFKATPGSKNKSALVSASAIVSEDAKEATKANTDTNNEISFENTTLSEDALEAIYNRVKSQKEHKALSNATSQHEKIENSNGSSLKASPISTSRRSSLSDDDDPKVFINFTCLSMFTQDSFFNSKELLSTRVLPSLRNTYKGAYVNSNDWQFSSLKVSRRI